MRLDGSDRDESLLEDDKNLVDEEAIPPDTRSRRRGESRLETVKFVLAFVAIYFIWGSTYLAIRYAVETFSPLVTACLRQAVAGTILLGWALGRGFRRGVAIVYPAESLPRLTDSCRLQGGSHSRRNYPGA